MAEIEDTKVPIRDEWKCFCGQPAVTEIQNGWDNNKNAGAGGGVYVRVCERCYDDYCNSNRFENSQYGNPVKCVTTSRGSQVQFAPRQQGDREMSKYNDVDFHNLPRDAGQIVEIAYGILPDGCGGGGVLVRRSHDRSDGAVSYSHADLIGGEDEEFTPWNGTLPSHGSFENV